MDLETTGVRLCDISVIEISALRVRGHRIVDKYTTLINPGCRISPQSTAINHITDDMVADAPCIEQVIDDFLAFAGNDILLGYNLTSFDVNIMYDLVRRLKGQSFSNDFLDLYYCVRRCLKDKLSKKSLEMLCRYYGVNNEGEHRALVDCYLTKQCYDKMYQEFGDAMFVSSEADRRGYGWNRLADGTASNPTKKKNLWW